MDWKMPRGTSVTWLGKALEACFEAPQIRGNLRATQGKRRHFREHRQPGDRFKDAGKQSSRVMETGECDSGEKQAEYRRNVREIRSAMF